MSSTWSSLTSVSTKKPKVRITKLSDDELRQRIYANASVLFPTPATTYPPVAPTYSVVYATRPKTIHDKQLSQTDPPWQYALLVRLEPLTGESTPLLRGQAWSSPTPWSMVLQGLLDTTSVAVHRKFAGATLPPPPTTSSNIQPQIQPLQNQSFVHLNDQGMVSLYHSNPNSNPSTPPSSTTPNPTATTTSTTRRIRADSSSDIVPDDAELPPYERSSSSLLLDRGATLNRLQRENAAEAQRLALVNEQRDRAERLQRQQSQQSAQSIRS